MTDGLLDQHRKGNLSVMHLLPTASLPAPEEVDRQQTAEQQEHRAFRSKQNPKPWS
jgi:hypothetical protein